MSPLDVEVALRRAAEMRETALREGQINRALRGDAPRRRRTAPAIKPGLILAKVRQLGHALLAQRRAGLMGEKPC